MQSRQRAPPYWHPSWTELTPPEQEQQARQAQQEGVLLMLGGLTTVVSSFVTCHV